MTYSIGMNCADETAADVANYILADLRVRFIGDSGGQLLCDSMQASIIGAIKESAIRANRENAKEPIA